LAIQNYQIKLLISNNKKHKKLNIRHLHKQMIRFKRNNYNYKLVD